MTKMEKENTEVTKLEGGCFIVDAALNDCVFAVEKYFDDLKLRWREKQLVLQLITERLSNEKKAVLEDASVDRVFSKMGVDIEKVRESFR